MVLPGYIVLARRNNGLCAAQSIGLMAGLGVVGAIAVDASDGLVQANLIAQAWQHRRIARGVVHSLNGPDFQGHDINSKVYLAPLTMVVETTFLRFPLALVMQPSHSLLYY